MAEEQVKLPEEKKEELPAAASLIDKAADIAKRIEEGNKKHEELVARQEAIAAKTMLAGRADAGNTQKTPEQLTEEEAEKQASDIIKRFRK